MAYTPLTNLSDLAKDATPSQFAEKHIYQSLLLSMVGEVQKVEDLMSDMYSKRSIDTAIGVQLDNLGANMGVTRRLGQSDEEYRTAIFAEIFMRRSDGSANYIMRALKSIYKSDTVKIFEHNTKMTGGVIVAVHQTQDMVSAVPIMKRMSPVAIQTVGILRDPTPTGVAWTPVEVEGATTKLVTDTADWVITNGGLGIVVQAGTGSVQDNKIGSLGDPGFTVSPIDLEQQISPPDAELGIYARGGDRLLNVEMETPVGGIYGVMAEVSQLLRGDTQIQGEQ